MVVYPLTLTDIADAQRKNQELKAYFKKNAIMPQKDIDIRGNKSAMQKWESNNSNISSSKGS